MRTCPRPEGWLPGSDPALTGSGPQLVAMESAAEILVDSPDVVYSPEAIEARYEYRTTRVSREGGVLRVRPGRGRWRTLGARGPATHSRLFLGAAHGYAFHLPHRPAGAPARGHVGGLGREQRLHAHCGCSG